MMQVAEGFSTVALVESASFGPFQIPDCIEFQALDAGEIQKSNLMAWAIGLGQPLAIQVHELSAGNIGEFMMEALAAQALLCLPGINFEIALPRECLGRVLTFEMQPRRAVDPPVPLLFLTAISREIQGHYNAAVKQLLTGQGGDMRQLLPALLAESVGTLTRSEVFYLLARVQSLATGAYRQRYDTGNVYGRE